jgi:hypothetical protein
MAPTLLVLAAGMGSRYGGLKQVDPVGPSGETVLDYAVFDARRAGFGKVVFVIRKDFEELFRTQIGAKYAGQIAVDYVFQSLDALPAGATVPAGREKPWGTGHAVWCAREAVREPFAVINADDFYGADSFAQLGKFLASPSASPRGFDPMSGHPAPRTMAAQFAMVGFTLANTLSEHGAVARGICASGPGGMLESITEQTGILAADVGMGRKFSGKEIASMNCWGFTPALFAGLERQLNEFLADVARVSSPVMQASACSSKPASASDAALKREFYLPAAVSGMIARREAEVRVLPTDSAWFGVTYREDKPRVVAAIAELVRAGKYPAKLF